MATYKFTALLKLYLMNANLFR